MMAAIRWFGLSLVLLFSLSAQEVPQRRKPVLHREEAPAADEEAEIILDPLQAEKEVEVGDFYLRKKNYEAAESRYRQAIRFQPTWAEPYEKLVKALEKQKKFQPALDACELFLLTNPDSEQAGRFQDLAARFRKKL